MTKLAQFRYKAYLRAQEEASQRFISDLKALTPQEKKEILIGAGVLTKRGKFTARYRPSKRRTASAKRATR